MRSALARALREAAAAPLPPGAFLRRDRGDALFVTDAPRLRPQADWPRVFTGAGFLCARRGELICLMPDAGWLRRLESAFPEPPDQLCATLRRFAGRSPDGASLGLFALGARALDGGEGGARFDRALRRRAAECLRLGRDAVDAPGGGLYACALLDHLLNNAEAHFQG